ncbi:rhamnan synthesis F family protein [Pseudotabrizicola algicola]|uniref:Uncharacterized protein n=1 Tax=Pseudotabrizicola algicola TaxID=2709381 RepID=A0A6B3RN23_9RHOB|nr:rhamnan synthesis F family protein [Pseudotabrizicola algicola]NEX46593.1 hypothetical protein [Pseudotabrizicola algicola]
MLQRYLRYARLGFRILVMTAAERRYVKAIRQSGLFDREWYLTCNPRLPRLCRMLPERHYVLVGEAVGMCPSKQFSPRAYAHLNPDQALSGLPPLAHYLAFGRTEGREVLDRPAAGNAPVLPVLTGDERPDPPARFAVVLHLYYREMWDEFAARLKRQRFAFDLFVTLSEDQALSDAGVCDRILAEFPNARVWTLPNHGRDILPFLHLVRSGLFAPYAAVCKLHSKKSLHRNDGDAWRDALVDGVMGDPAATLARLQRFVCDPDAGLWVADGHLARGEQWWGPNRERGEILLARTEQPVASGVPELVFAAGSIYWLRPAALAAMADLPVSAGDFEPEMGQVDGTMAHVMERVIGIVTTQSDLRIRESSDLDGAEV